VLSVSLFFSGQSYPDQCSDFPEKKTFLKTRLKVESNESKKSNEKIEYKTVLRYFCAMEFKKGKVTIFF